MLQQLNKYISSLRSNLLMGKYQQALLQYQHINKLVCILESLNVSPKQLQLIKNNIKEQMQQAQEIINILQPSIEQYVQNVQNNGQLNHQRKESFDKQVGKWGAKSSKWKQKSGLYESHQIQHKKCIQKMEQNKDNQEKIMKGVQQKLPEQDWQKVQRDIILPLTLPDFFKNKPPSRLIICPLQDVKSLINLLSQSILIKIQQTDSVQDLQLIKQKKDDQISVYMIPWVKKQKGKHLINRKLQQINCLIILYSDQIKYIKIQKQLD